MAKKSTPTANKVKNAPEPCFDVRTGMDVESNSPTSSCTPVMYHSLDVLSARFTWPTALLAFVTEVHVVDKVPDDLSLPVAKKKFNCNEINFTNMVILDSLLYNNIIINLYFISWNFSFSWGCHILTYKLIIKT